MRSPLPLLLLALLLAAPSLQAQRSLPSGYEKRPSGLALTLDAGLLVANDKQADFYSGRPENPNKLDNILHSELYGTQIWNSLVDRGEISPSAIHDYGEFQVAEYPKMYYKLAYQLGVGFRYDYNSMWGWFLRFDYSQLNAAGQFQLSSNNGTGILGSNQYVTGDIFGREKRIHIDFALLKRIPLSPRLDMEIDLGFNFNNTKVLENAISIGGGTYSILDVWGGREPTSTTGTYEYMNQGTIGYGGFGSLAVGYVVSGATIDLGYTCYYTQTKFLDYNEEDAFALQHIIFVRFNVNNFKFF